MNELLKKDDGEQFSFERGVPADTVHRRIVHAERVPTDAEREQARVMFENKNGFVDREANAAIAAKHAAKLHERAYNELHQTLTNADIEAYARGLKRAIEKLADRQGDLDDDSPEMQEFVLLQEKLKILNQELTVPEGTPRGQESMLARRNAVQRERRAIDREKKKVDNEISMLLENRSKYKRWNPLHWPKMAAIDKDIAERHAKLEDLRLRSIKAAQNVIVTSGPTYELPQREVSRLMSLNNQDIAPLDDDTFEQHEQDWFDKAA